MHDSSNPEGSSADPLAKGKGLCFQSSPSRLKRFVMFDNSGGKGRVFIHPSLAQELFPPSSQKHKEEEEAIATDPLLSNSNHNPSIISDESVEGEPISRITAYRKMVSSAFSSLQMLRNSRNEDLVFGEHKLLTHDMLSNINANTNDISCNINSNTNDIRSTVAVNTNNMLSNINSNTNFSTATSTINETRECRVSEAFDNIPTTLYHFDRDLHKDSMASETLAFQRNEPKVFATMPSGKKARVSETLGSFSEFFSPFSKDHRQNQNDNANVVKNSYYHYENDVKNHSYHEAESVSTEVWENPDDLDALLSSDDDEEDDEDDDVRSTGHSPGESSSEKGESYNEDKDDEEEHTQKLSKKRERIDDEEQGQKSTSKRGKISEENQKGRNVREQLCGEKVQNKMLDKKKRIEEVDGVQFKIENENEASISEKQSIERKLNLCTQEYRRQKIKKTMKALRRMIPGGSLLDASLVLDGTIQYVKNLCDQVKKLESVRFPPQQP